MPVEVELIPPAHWLVIMGDEKGEIKKNGTWVLGLCKIMRILYTEVEQNKKGID